MSTPSVARSAAPARLALGCGVLFAVPLCIIGIVALGFAMRLAGQRQWAPSAFLTVFAMMFGGAGVRVIRRAIGSRTAGARHSVPAVTAPPVTHFVDNSRSTMWFAWIFALFWSAISVPVAVVVVKSAMSGGERMGLIALIFPVAGIGLTIWAVIVTIRQRKFGSSTLDLSTAPAAAGTGLSGMVRAGPALLPAREVTVRLSCINRVVTGSGKNRSTSERVLWQDDCSVPTQRDGRGIFLAVSIDIPPDARPTDDSNRDNRILWRLEAMADLPGVDYHATFEIPVVHTAASDAAETVAAFHAHEAARLAEYRRPADSQIRVEPWRGGVQLWFPAGRNIPMALAMTCFLLVWSGVVALLVVLGAPLLFVVVFGGFDLLFMALVLQQWSGTSLVQANHDGLSVTTRLAGIRTVRKRAADQVADIKIGIGMQAGSRAYYRLQAADRDGKKLTLGDGIGSREEAEWLAEQVRAALGRTTDSG
jgi:hypothetical protein